MTKLSVNINKIATLRNARGGNIPNVVQAAIDCEAFGAQGITVHPRPDERHIRYQDVSDLKNVLTTEFNIEGNPRERKFVDLVLDIQPAQVTLVPDYNAQLTSDQGWNTIQYQPFLKSLVPDFQAAGIRVSIFIDPSPALVEAAATIGAKRVEFFTGPYASKYHKDPVTAIKSYIEAVKVAQEVGLGINAGHDLNLDNLRYFAANMPDLLEVSIGHALISDALYYGLENTIQMYLRQLNHS